MIQYQEEAPNRKLAVMDAAGDYTPFLPVGVGSKVGLNGGYATGSTERRLDEILRLLIRRVDVGPRKIASNVLHATKITGPRAVAAGIKDSLRTHHERLPLLVTSELIEAEFELVFARRPDVAISEAAQVQDYPIGRYGTLTSIMDESERSAGLGYFAVRMTTHTLGTYAVELFVDDFD